MRSLRRSCGSEIAGPGIRLPVRWGYQIIEWNYTTGAAIYIIALQGDNDFVEVKTRPADIFRALEIYSIILLCGILSIAEPEMTQKVTRSKSHSKDMVMSSREVPADGVM
jgi:hypothetical protein